VRIRGALGDHGKAPGSLRDGTGDRRMSLMLDRSARQLDSNLLRSILVLSGTRGITRAAERMLRYQPASAAVFGSAAGLHP